MAQWKWIDELETMETSEGARKNAVAQVCLCFLCVGTVVCGLTSKFVQGKVADGPVTAETYEKVMQQVNELTREKNMLLLQRKELVKELRRFNKFYKAAASEYNVGFLVLSRGMVTDAQMGIAATYQGGSRAGSSCRKGETCC